MPSNVIVIQTISDDQNSVYSDLNELLDNNSINNTDIDSISIVPFGQNKFLIVVAYHSS